MERGKMINSYRFLFVLLFFFLLGCTNVKEEKHSVSLTESGIVFPSANQINGFEIKIVKPSYSLQTLVVEIFRSADTPKTLKISKLVWYVNGIKYKEVNDKTGIVIEDFPSKYSMVLSQFDLTELSGVPTDSEILNGCVSVNKSLNVEETKKTFKVHCCLGELKSSTITYEIKDSKEGLGT
jgi:hypothetical protein